MMIAAVVVDVVGAAVVEAVETTDWMAWRLKTR